MLSVNFFRLIKRFGRYEREQGVRQLIILIQNFFTLAVDFKVLQNEQFQLKF